MGTFSIARVLAAFAIVAAPWVDHAHALEGGSNALSGLGIGLPSALPPPGLYLINTVAYTSGSLDNGSGHPVGVNGTSYVEVHALLWASPFRILGGQYAAAITQPVLSASLTGAAGPGVTEAKTGLFNTVVTPGILSWALPFGFFASANFSIFAKDGDTGARGDGTSTQTHVAGNAWTFAPGGGIAWFNGLGFETGLNLFYDISTADDDFARSATVNGITFPATVKLQSGDLLEADFTAQQALGGALRKWSVGAGGYYAVQVTDDRTTTSIPALGVSNLTQIVAAGQVNGKGNRFEKFALGPLLGYDLTPVALQLWWTQDIFAKNTIRASTLFMRVSLPL
jgi:hypothetical protein